MSDPARNLRRASFAIGVLAAAGGGLLAPGCDDSGHGPTDAGSVLDGDGRIIAGSDGPIGKPTDASAKDAPRSDAAGCSVADALGRDAVGSDAMTDAISCVVPDAAPKDVAPAAKDVMADGIPPACDIVKQDCPGLHRACYPDKQGKAGCGASLDGAGGSQCVEDVQCAAGFLCGAQHNGAGVCLPICRLPDTPCRNNIACIAVAGLGAGYCEQF